MRVEGTAPEAQQEHALAKWLGRQQREKLSPAQIERLESLPTFTWDTRNRAFLARYADLVAFLAESGGVMPSQTSADSNEKALGRWVSQLRRAKTAASAPTGRTGARTMILDAFRASRLEALPTWSWDPTTDAHLARAHEIAAWRAKTGRLWPRQCSGTDDASSAERKLAVSINNVRRANRKGSLPPAAIAAYEAVSGGWKW